MIKSYMSGFMGYGNVRSKFWFVGLEEGGSGKEEVVKRKILSWHKRGRNKVEDLSQDR